MSAKMLMVPVFKNEFGFELFAFSAAAGTQVWQNGPLIFCLCVSGSDTVFLPSGAGVAGAGSQRAHLLLSTSAAFL